MEPLPPVYHSRRGSSSIISLTGGLFADKIKKSYPYIDMVFGTQMFHRLPEFIYKRMNGSSRIFEIELPNDNNVMVKQNMYGLLADAIVGGYIQGTEIHGGKLEIGGEKGKFIVHEDGSVEILTANDTPVYATKNDVDLIEYATKYRVELSYEGNTIFSTTEQSCKVTCEVYEGTTKITNKITAFNWYLNSVLYKTTTEPNITIKNDSFEGSTQLNCQVTFDEEIL